MEGVLPGGDASMLSFDAVRDWCIGACCGADQLQKMSDCCHRGQKNARMWGVIP